MAGNIHLRWKPDASSFPAPITGVETYGFGHDPVNGDTTLQWIAFIHDDVPRPVGIVVHIGEYKYGSPGPAAVCRDLYYAGYNAVAIAHRLADPGHEMHPPNGDQPVADHGLFPEQTNDMAVAVDNARLGGGLGGLITPERVTGKVFGVGGSAGGSHVAHLAGATVSIPGHGAIAQMDAGVCLSGGFNFQIDSPLLHGTNANDDWRNYCGCTVGAACDGVGGIRDLASPYHQFTSASSPVLLFATDEDPMPVGQFDFMTARLTSVGAPYDSRKLTGEVPFQANGATRHAFQYWYPVTPSWPDSVKDETITWLQSKVPPP